MSARPPSLATPRRDGGFALILVLWALVLIAFIISHITATARTEVRIASNVLDNAVAEATADGAIYQAIFNLSDPNPKRRWPIDGREHELFVSNNRAIVRLEDEAWRINPNLASPALLEALLRVTGSAPESARHIAGAMSEWVGSSPADRPQNVVLAEYRAAGLEYGPPREPLETVDELGRVLGVTPAVLATIRPHLTIFGPPEPNLASPDPVVVEALAQLHRVGQAGVNASVMVPDVSTVRITAIGLGRSNARFIRYAIVRVGGPLPHGYEVLAWGTQPP